MSQLYALVKKTSWTFPRTAAHYYDVLLGPLGIEYTETSTKHDRTLDTFY